MIRRIPIVPTLVVLAAVAVMIALGFWQLGRLQEKQALIERYAAAVQSSAEVPWPGNAPPRPEEAAYRRSRIDCRADGSVSAISGSNARGEGGWAHVARCSVPGGGSADVVLGWARDPQPRSFGGGPVSGVIGLAAGGRLRLVADPPLAGLEANALPDPRNVPNNHLSYAVQWFLFAATALIIYALALRNRLAGAGQGG